MNMALPIAFYVFYIVLLGIYNFIVRYSATKNRQLKLSYFRTYSGDAPDAVIVAGRHFDNQFQVPLLFFITCLATQVFNAVDTTALILAWAFIGTRLIHTFVHLTSNNVLRRALSFFAGFICIIGMWIHILFAFD